MTALVSTGAVPTIGADADVWGGELNTEVQAQHTDLEMLNTSPTSRILGRVTASTGEVERLTGAQAATILPAVVGDSGSGGTKGLVPAPAPGDAAAGKFLAADGSWEEPYGERKAWAVFTGSTGAKVGGRNVSISRAGTGDYDITFTVALANTNYAVLLSQSPVGGSPASPQLLSCLSKTVNGFTIGSIDYDLGVAVDPAQVYFEVLG